LDEPLSGVDPVGRMETIRLFQDLAERGKCLVISSHELEELEKLTDHIVVMARGRIAAVGTLAQIRELLDDQPLTIRIDARPARPLSQALLGLADVVGVEFGDGDTLLVSARNPRRFFRDLAGLVLEEDFDVRRMEPLDESAAAILGYVLGGRKHDKV